MPYLMRRLHVPHTTVDNYAHALLHSDQSQHVHEWERDQAAAFIIIIAISVWKPSRQSQQMQCPAMQSP